MVPVQSVVDENVLIDSKADPVLLPIGLLGVRPRCASRGTGSARRETIRCVW